MKLGDIVNQTSKHIYCGEQYGPNVSCHLGVSVQCLWASLGEGLETRCCHWHDVRLFRYHLGKFSR